MSNTITGYVYGQQDFVGTTATNTSAGTISSKYLGVELSPAQPFRIPAIFYNYGTVLAYTGVVAYASDVINDGTIMGSTSVQNGGTSRGIGVILNGVGGGTNSGVISGGGVGMYLGASIFPPSDFANGGTIFGDIGIKLANGTLFDSGTIASTDTAGNDVAIYFARYYPTSSSALELEPGAVIDGNISGFASDDLIIENDFMATSETYNGSDLVLIGSSGNETLAMSGSFSTNDFHLTIAAESTTISLIPCFTTGTNILTPRGCVAVENLAVGDLVITGDGTDEPIIWIGRRRIDLTRHARPAEVQPILIAANAFADNVPDLPLTVSPDHALFLLGHLIPAKALINGCNVTQMNRLSVDYYHIELTGHDIIFANNAAVESYLETGNRAAFNNSGPAIFLHPDFAQTLRETRSCAPFADTGLAVEAVRQRLLERFYGSTSLRANRTA